jgi:hypothetical protein
VIVLFYIEEGMASDPIGAIVSMKERVYDHERFGNLVEYMEHLAHSVWRFHGIGLDIKGSTLEEKCASCLDQLVSKGLIILN